MVLELVNLLPPDEPVVQGLKLFQEYFANARELIMTVRSEQPEAAEQATRWLAERLRKETNVVASVTWQPPWLENPGYAAEFLAYLWFNQPPEVFGQLTNRLAPAKLQLPLTKTQRAARLALGMS